MSFCRRPARAVTPRWPGEAQDHVVGWPASLRGRLSALHRGVLWSGTGSAFYALCQYGMLMSLARLGSPTHVGQFALAQALATPIIIVSQMQLRQLQVTDAAEEQTYGQYFGTRLVASAAAVAIIVLIAVVSQYRGEMLLVISCVALAKALESLSDIVHGVLQRAERMDLIARALVIKGTTSLIVFAALLALTGQLLISVAGMAAVWAVLLLTYDLRLAASVTGQRLEIDVDGAVVRTLARTALPLSIASGLLALSASIPRYVLEATQGPEAVGLFAVASIPLAILAVANNAVHQATLPRAATHFHQGELEHAGRIARTVATLQVAGGAVLALVLFVAGGPIMRVLFGPEYVPMAPLAAIMAAGVAISGAGAWGTTMMMAGRRFNLQLTFVGAIILLQVPAALLLITRFGPLGAAWSEFAKYTMAAVLLGLLGRHAVRTHAVPPDEPAELAPPVAHCDAAPRIQ